MVKDEPKKARVEELTVRSNAAIGSQYSQVVGVTVTDTEVTLEFVYINPRAKTQGEVVARITLPITSAQELAKVINDTINKHNADKKKV